jgi:hypothetical protein
VRAGPATNRVKKLTPLPALGQVAVTKRKAPAFLRKTKAYRPNPLRVPDVSGNGALIIVEEMMSRITASRLISTRWCLLIIWSGRSMRCST